MQVFANTLAMIGHTPMVELTRIDPGPCRLFLKLEDHNPGGSIKDRIALNMIETAEKAGLLKPGMTIIEATAGNTGLGLALVAAFKGYRLILVLPDKMSGEKIAHLRALGAEVVITRSDVNKGHPEYYQDVANRLVQEIPNSYYINQFNNPANPQTHERTTAPEIWQQMDEDVDCIVFGVGSGGTATGMASFFKRIHPQIQLIIADPKGSIVADYVNTHTLRESYEKWLVEGIGEDFIPSICDLSLIDEAITVSDKESFDTAREVLRKEGLLIGASAGTMLHAALQYCRRQQSPKRVVTILCDTGNKYLSKMYNDDWLIDQGLLAKVQTHDLREMMPLARGRNALTYVHAEDSLAVAWQRIKKHSITALPVLDAAMRVIGLITERDLLQAITDHASLSQPVATKMQANPVSVPLDLNPSQLLSLFQQHDVIAITDAEQYFGMITRSDYISYRLRTKEH